MKVGDTLYIFDENHRVYPPTPKGSLYSSGGPIYREHFRPRKIINETKVSWVLEFDNQKVNKKTLAGAYTLEGIEEQCWKHDYGYKLLDHIRIHANGKQLREIAALIGWKP